MRRARNAAAAAAAASAAAAIAHGFYLPGVHPMQWRAGEIVTMRTAKLASAKTHLPYDPFQLPFCRPSSGNIGAMPANLGEVIQGDITHESPYQLRMKENATCRTACTVEGFDKQGHASELFKKLVDEGPYLGNLRLDNMPAILMREVVSETPSGTETRLVAQGKGYPIGYRDDAQAEQIGAQTPYFVVNHLTFWISYHDLEPDALGNVYSRIVGLFVTAATVRQDAGGYGGEGGAHACERPGSPPQPAEGDVRFTYSVNWVPSEVRWATRWDQLLKMDAEDAEMNWFAITNSMVITACLAFMVAVILLRTLRKDVAMYNARAAEAAEFDDADAFEAGWKLVATDVFRPPQRPELLAALVGIGEQCLCSAVAILGVSLLGFFSPANRGALMTSAFVFFALLGVVGGHASARAYKMFAGVHRKRVVTRVATWLPGTFFSVYLALDLWAWHEGSTGAVPFTAMLSILAMWFLVSTPLVVLGAYLGFKADDAEVPVKPTQIPRQLPERQPWWMTTPAMAAAGGAVVFAVLFVQAFYILTKLWLNEFVYMFGFLFAVFAVVCVASAELSIIGVYLTLCSEDHRWWWKGFLIPAPCGLYLWLVTMFYFAPSVPHTTWLTVVMLTAYSAMGSAVVCLVSGTVGFHASVWFCRAIYSAIKSE